ncbi:isomerase [Kribbella sandramycini]|uniref:Isomerase n=1 Tax=Kribbella sandramycini TaxID=60450 RepID=A0A7Y4KXU1_9ACTN|nr:isomerase [Kribbella sandramycini]MBB6569533.1 5-carboxymethyl-2-hydroxymuconate isomerase [Kribbella sandramycini]NOL40633.1 isomerase [Kribbella sandramycini]
MPHIVVEYSESLAEAFDREGFAVAFHPAAAELIGSSLPGFKTRFVRLGEAVLGAGGAMVHVQVAILPGRDEALKAQLGELALGVLAEHLKPVPGLTAQLTCEVRDLGTYSKLTVEG